VAAVGLHVAAERRDLVADAVGDHRDRAMRMTRWHRLQAGGFHRGHDRIRHYRRGEIDLPHRAAEQCIAHRTANDAGPPIAAAERREDGADARCP
jgi:hypothetical protein